MLLQAIENAFAHEAVLGPHCFMKLA